MHMVLKSFKMFI